MDITQLLAMAKQSRRDKSLLPQFRRAATAMSKHHEAKIDEITDVIVMAHAPVAKLAKPLTPPDGYVPVAVFDGDDCGVYYINDTTDDMIEVAWPFDRDRIWPDDCREHGIRVEYS